MATASHPGRLPETEELPPDLETMRATARLLLGPDDAPDAMAPTAHTLDTLACTLRGQIELMAPEVEAIAVRQDEDDVSRYCALACVGEARMKLRPDATGLYGEAAGARRLARVLNALCDHYENLRPA